MSLARFKLKRVYEEPSPQDGCRVLVERLWPRGLSKKRAALDLWLKDVAPSAALRTWFGHDSEKWLEFKELYLQELKTKAAANRLLEQKREEGAVTLLYAARDLEHNGALVLRTLLEHRRPRRRR